MGDEVSDSIPADHLAKLYKATREIKPFTQWPDGAVRVQNDPNAGDLTIVLVHGRWRPALILSIGPRRARVAYYTPNRLNNADRHHTNAPMATYRPLDELASPAPMLAVAERRTAAAATKNAADDDETAEVIGDELAVFAGMLFDAGISFNLPGQPGAAKLDGSASWVEHEGRKRKRARVTVELRNHDIVKLAEWLRGKGVKGI